MGKVSVRVEGEYVAKDGNKKNKIQYEESVTVEQAEPSVMLAHAKKEILKVLKKKYPHFHFVRTCSLSENQKLPDNREFDSYEDETEESIETDESGSEQLETLDQAETIEDQPEETTEAEEAPAAPKEQSVAKTKKKATKSAKSKAK